MNKPLIITALVLAMGTVTPSLAAAQTSDNSLTMMGGSCPMMGMMGQGASGRGMMGGGMMSGNMMGTQQSNMGAMADRRLADLKDKLKITSGQIDAWNAYADAVKARVAIMQGTHAAMMNKMTSGSAVDRMYARVTSMQAMVDGMKAVTPAIGKLYAALTAEQRKTADQLIGMDCGAM